MTQMLQINTGLLDINKIGENRISQICDGLSHLQMICGHLVF
jgi:hypothetical protein